MSLVQDFLRGGGTVEQLTERYHIAAKRHAEFPSLVLLKYNQISSPMAEPLVQQCRGIILDESDGWEIVSRPFDKFFNYGEPLAVQLDWSTAKAQEKLDGSLMQLYWYDDAWRVASSGTPDASGPVNATAETFAQLFWRVWKEKGYRFPEETKFTFLFELMTPINRVVVRHLRNDLKLIGVRGTGGGQEFDPNLWAAEFDPVRSFPLQTIGEIYDSFAAMDPVAQEGYVVVDSAFRRLKVKHPGYVALHQMRDGFGPKRILDTIRRGETSELLVHFPEWAEAFGKVQSAYNGLVSHLEGEYQRLRAIESQKEFALEAVKTKHSGSLFRLRAGKVGSIKEALADVQIDTLMDLLQVRDIQL